MNEKLELEVGTPVTVTFAYDSGKLCQKRFPGAEDSYARQTNDGRVLFVDSADEMRLRKSVRAGVPVIICREQTKAGARYLTIKTPPPEMKGPLAVVHSRQIPDAKYADVAKAEVTPMPADGGLLARCLVEAVEAAKAGQAHAAAIGFPLTFTSADVQDLASTIFIQRCRDGAIVERLNSRLAGGAHA